jgi:stage V sporulation protein S
MEAEEAATTEVAMVTHITANGSINSNGFNQATTQGKPMHDKTDKSEIIKVSAQSRSTAVAGAIAGIIREQGRVDVQAIGAGAVNQAMKAAAIARGYLLLDGINAIIIPSFSDVIIEGSERTAVRMSIEPR